jgi:hypothetical protein
MTSTTTKKQTPERLRLKHFSRKQSGSGMVEASAGLFLVVTAVVLSVFLFLNCMLVSYYKDKLTVITDTAAAHAASLCMWNGFPIQSATESNLQGEATQTIDQALSALGLPSANVVSVRKNQNSLTVSVTVNNFPIKMLNYVFPGTVTLSSTSEAPYPNDHPPALLYLSFGATYPGLPQLPPTTMVIPAYGKIASPSVPGAALLRNEIFGQRPVSQFSMSFQGGYSERIAPALNSSRG